MLRLPRFRYVAARSAQEASSILAELGPRGMAVAGGTDLYPKMKRRQFEPEVLVGLTAIPGLSSIRREGPVYEVGATVTLETAAADPGLAAALPGYTQAAGLVSSPPLRAAGTAGGNLCVDTRCNYYDMTYEWRKSVGFCMKKDGDICLVAPGSPRCWAVSSSDTAPVAIALGAAVVLAGPDGDREVPAAALYRDDGIDYLTKLPHEVVTSIRLPADPGTRSAYVKLRRRGSIDFPIAGAAVAVRLEGDLVAGCRIVLGAVGSHPVEALEASRFLLGQTLNGETAMHAAELAAKPAKPLDNADLNHFWRKRMVRVVVEDALMKCISEPRG